MENRLKHLTFNYDRYQKSSSCMLKTRMSIWYECEKKNYLFSFTDFMYDDIKLVPFTCSHLIGKNISQRFTNGSGEDS